MARTQEDRRAETRRLLLEAAADLFARKGFHATSAEAVASAANRTTGALYDHFGGKEGLLVALVDLWVGQTIVDLDERTEMASDIESRIAEIFLSKLNEGKQVITSEDVQSLISTMGSVNDFRAAEAQEVVADEAPKPDSNQEQAKSSGSKRRDGSSGDAPRLTLGLLP